MHRTLNLMGMLIEYVLLGTPALLPNIPLVLYGSFRQLGLLKSFLELKTWLRRLQREEEEVRILTENLEKYFLRKQVFQRLAEYDREKAKAKNYAFSLLIWQDIFLRSAAVYVLTPDKYAFIQLSLQTIGGQPSPSNPSSLSAFRFWKILRLTFEIPVATCDSPLPLYERYFFMVFTHFVTVELVFVLFERKK